MTMGVRRVHRSRPGTPHTRKGIAAGRIGVKGERYFFLAESGVGDGVGARAGWRQCDPSPTPTLLVLQFCTVCTACCLRRPLCVHVSRLGLSPYRPLIMAARVSTFSNKDWNSAGAMIAERCPLVTRPASSPYRVWPSFGCFRATIFLESLDHGQIILLCCTSIGK